MRHTDQLQWMHPRLAPSSRYLEFPPPEVVAFLVDVYFTHSNIYYPVLHPPTFRRLLDEGLHHRDGDFSGILLVVCAIGARFSNHPYLADATAESRNRRIAHWLSQTREVMKKPFTSTATLFEVQYYCVSGLPVGTLDSRARVESPSFLVVRDMS